MPESTMRPPGIQVVTAGEAAAGSATRRHAEESSEKWVYSMSGNIERAGVWVQLGIEDESGDNHWLKQAHQPGDSFGSVSWSGKTPVPRGKRLKATFKGALVAGDLFFFSAITEVKVT